MNLGALALGLACLGVSIVEGLFVSSFISSCARHLVLLFHPEMQSKLMSGVFLGVAFIEGTFFVTLAMTFVLK